MQWHLLLLAVCLLEGDVDREARYKSSVKYIGRSCISVVWIVVHCIQGISHRVLELEV